MLDKFIESLTAEQKMALIQSLSDSMEPQVEEEPVVVTTPKQESSRDVDLDFSVAKNKDQDEAKLVHTYLQY